AAYCGTAGYKPPYGRVSCHGVVPLAHSMDHPGPLANSVADLAILLQTIAGPDPLDPACANRPVPDYVAHLAGGSALPRLGRLRGFFVERADAAMAAHVDQVAAALRAKGAEVVDVALPAAFAEVSERHRVVM